MGNGRVMTDNLNKLFYPSMVKAVLTSTLIFLGRVTSPSAKTPIKKEEEEIVDAPENDGNASMPEQVKRPNPWRKMAMMMTMKLFYNNK
jgi:hypothetical protein